MSKTPSILVTDSRAPNQRKSPFPLHSLQNISLDSLLARVDQVPSARKRALPNDPRARLQNQNAPQRTSKTSQKLVLLPEHQSPPPDRPEERPEDRLLPRVTAYCIAEAFRLTSTQSFLSTTHDVNPKIYDEALYTAYWLPLLPGVAGYRVKSSPEPTPPEPNDTASLAEMLVFSYGVVCFWNFSESQERSILADLTFGSSGSLLTRPLLDKDVQIEDLHFEYSPTTQRPRIYNDLITLRSADHMIKLAMSHAIAQSVKMTVFEERMESTLYDTQHVPKELALTGELKMQQTQVLKMSGKLFKLRVDVNLSSNVLDTPDFFWDSEPTLLPLYTAVRDYLEIKSRIHALNEKCTVIFDLVDILSDSIASSTMHRITWIIIALVALSVIVTTLEVAFRFAILRRPTLTEILDRKSLPPVDLFSFYIYMRDQQRSVDYLDLWLDISQHTNLCRLYVRELRRSLLDSTPDLEKAETTTANQVTSTLRGQSPLTSPTFEYVDRRSPSPSINRQSGDVSIAHPTNTVGRADLSASAERILYTYLIQGAEREVPLPAHIVQSISTAIEVEGRDDPQVFDEAQDYIFQAMERDAAPGFLAAKALGNLVPPSCVLRLVIGLLALLGSLWTSFSLIFLDIKPKTTRLWVLFPFTVALYSLLAHHFNLDPIIALAGYSESTFTSFIRIREPYVRKLLISRSLWVLFLTLVSTTALTLLFTLVPGKRL